jgi:hypothetical protein
MNHRRIFASAALLFAVTLGFAQPSEVVKTQCGTPTGQQRFPVIFYQELPQFVQPDPVEWRGVKGVNVSWADKNVRYPATTVPLAHSLTRQTLTGWRGERVFAQAVVWTARTAADITYEISDLRGKEDSKIPSACIETGFVRYVMADELNKDGSSGCSSRPDHTVYDSSMVADCVDPSLKSLAMSPMQTRAIWLTCWIPQETPAGNYRGTLTVREAGKAVGSLRLDLQVEDHVLPLPKDWAFHLDLWQNPYAVARYYQVPLWSEAHLEAMRPIMQRLAEAGQKVITASIIHRPWNGQTEDAFSSMVTWVRKLDGTWEYSFEVFDRWVEFMMSCGITGQINCYSMIPWRLTFPYFDCAENTLKELQAEPGDPAYADFWGHFLAVFARHLKEKGWFDRTTIAMDERSMKVMQETIAVIREADPDFKISLAGNYYPEIEQEIFDYCSGWRGSFPDDVIERRRAEGKFTTYYTCCAESTPNTFTFSPLEEASYIGRAIAVRNADGYLRWAFNSWPLEPLLDSRFRTWASGDTFLVYPGNRTSLRFEHLIEGIQVFEKQRLSKEL